MSKAKKYGECDASALRLCLLKKRLEEEYTSEEVLSFTENLPEKKRKIFTSISPESWIQGDIELELLNELCAFFTAWRLLVGIGKASFQQLLERHVLAEPKVKYEWELGIMLAWYVGLLSNRVALNVHWDETEGLCFQLRYVQMLDPKSLIDLLFYEGFIRAFFDHQPWLGVDLQVTKTTLLEKDWPKKAAVHEGIAWGQGIHEYVLKGDILKKNYDPDLRVRPVSKVHSEEQIQSILAKTAQLLEDKRELATSVEFLHMANAELEKKIQISHKELAMARNIQKGFVPRRLPDWKGLQFWVKYYPMTEVSGDFYDYFTFGANRLGVLVCDVSGHGVPAALITAIAKLSFNSHRLDSPADVYTHVNLDMLRYVKQEGYMTGFYLIIDADYKVTYSRAAGPSAILFRAETQEIEVLETRGTLLGMFPDANRHYEDRETKLKPGDKIFIYTDGITEGENTKGEMFGEERLFATIQETAGLDVQRSSEHVMKAFERFTLGTDQGDDVTLLTLMLSERQAEFTQLISEARSLYFKKDYKAACQKLYEAIDIFPRHTTALYLLARYLAKDGQYKETIKYLNQYNALRPYNADAYTLLARSSYELDYYLPAIQHLKRSLSLRSENPRALYLLARVYLKLNDTAEANDAYARLMAVAPNSKYTKQLRKLLSEETDGRA